MAKEKLSMKKTATKQKVHYRFYGFGNFYLSSLQQGLQGGHTAVELFVKYEKKKPMLKQVKKWAKKDKVMVLLNGGNSANLKAIHDEFKQLKKIGMPYPFVDFHEDEESLNGALTYTGIVLPNTVFDKAAAVRQGDLLILDDEEKWMEPLINIINQYKLAN